MEFNEIRQLVITAADAFYNGGKLPMDDESYDKFKKEVELVEPSFNVFNHIKIFDRKRIKHPIQFQQPDYKQEFHNIDEFKSRYTGVEYIAPKYDGCSIRCYFLNGVYSDALTRSDEWSGARQFTKLTNKVPNKVHPSIKFIDFEACCSVEEFRIESRGKANGLINSVHKQGEVDSFLKLIPFKVGTDFVTDYKDQMTLAGFVEGQDYLLLDINNLPDYMDKKVKLGDKHYPIDGFAFYYHDKQNFKLHKHYSTEDVTAEVTGIQWNFSNKLFFVPKVLITPIYIEGRRVSRASSNGLDTLINKRCGVGAEVTIILAKSVIPQVSKVVKIGTDYSYSECQLCHSAVVTENEVTHCTNSKCSDFKQSINYELFMPCPFCGSRLEKFSSKARCSNIKCKGLYNSLARGFLWHMINSPENFNRLVGRKTIHDESDFRSIFEMIKPELNLQHQEILDKLGSAIAKSAVIERLSGQKLTWLTNILTNEIPNKNILDIVPNCLTWNQLSTFNHYKGIYHEIIQVIKNNHGEKL